MTQKESRTLSLTHNEGVSFIRSVTTPGAWHARSLRALAAVRGEKPPERAGSGLQTNRPAHETRRPRRTANGARASVGQANSGRRVQRQGSGRWRDSVGQRRRLSRREQPSALAVSCWPPLSWRALAAVRGEKPPERAGSGLQTNRPAHETRRPRSTANGARASVGQANSGRRVQRQGSGRWSDSVGQRRRLSRREWPSARAVSTTLAATRAQGRAGPLRRAFDANTHQFALTVVAADCEH
jgi:hypothetical protein